MRAAGDATVLVSIVAPWIDRGMNLPAVFCFFVFFTGETDGEAF